MIIIIPADKFSLLTWRDTLASLLFFPARYLCFMRIDIVTVLPELLDSPFSHSMMKRAQENGIVDLLFRLSTATERAQALRRAELIEARAVNSSSSSMADLLP